MSHKKPEGHLEIIQCLMCNFLPHQKFLSTSPGNDIPQKPRYCNIFKMLLTFTAQITTVFASMSVTYTFQT